MYISVRLEPVEDGRQSTKINGDVFVHAIESDSGMNNYVMTKAFGQCWPKGKTPTEVKKEWIAELKSSFPGIDVTISAALHMSMFTKASEMISKYSDRDFRKQKEELLLAETPEERMEKIREKWALSY